MGCALMLGLVCVFGVSPAVADCFPNPTNLVAWWPGDGNANDVAGANNGVLQGGATAGTAGMVAPAFSFDGTNGYVQIPDSAVLKPTNLTVEAWVRFSGLDSAGNAGAGQQYLVFKQNTRAGNFEGYALSKSRVTSGDAFNFTVSSSSGASVSIASSTLVSTGVWYHVAAVRGSNFLQLFVNGQLERQTNVSFAQDYGVLPVFFGSSGQAFFDGKLKGNLDEVSLYNRALSSNEIAAVYSAGAFGKCKTVTIATQPLSQAVMIGSNATFSVVATGFGSLAHRWRFNGTNISGATNANLTLTNVQPVNGGNYTAVVTNALGSATSSVAVLTVNIPPGISVPPSNQTKNAGAAVSFGVTATGTALLSYQWRKGGVPLSGQTSNVLAISAVTTNDIGSYDVVVTNVAGSVTSSPVATLTVNVPPTLTVLPVSQAVNLGGSLSFSVTAVGTAPLSYQWRKSGAPLSGKTSNVLAFSAVTTNDAGSYDVMVTNVAGSVTSSPPAILAVNVPPTITVLPANQTANAGDGVSFSVTAVGTAPLNYQWRKGGIVISGETSNVLTFSALATNDAGSYDVIVANVAGGVTSSPPATLVVYGTNIPPVITVSPQSQITNVGGNVSFNVTATGTMPLSYQWLKGGEPLSGRTNNALVLSAVTTNDAGSYDVVVTNVAGSVTSSPPATLTVNVPPVITVLPTNQTTIVGSNVNFGVTVTGTDPLSYQWRKGGVPLSGQTSNVLALSAVTTNITGSYDVVVTNVAGSVTSSPAALLTVIVPPAITSLPFSQTANVGGNASFTVTATGTAPLNYQWRKGGAPLNGRTNNVLAFSLLTTNDAGSFDVVVTNLAGGVTSSPTASLIVNLPPVNPPGADAVVLVNSASARHLDFRNNIQPYLNHFGVPYTVLDIKTNPVTAQIGERALIIVGHRELDTNHVYLDAAEQGFISLAVSNGTGLVNFDYALSGGGVSSNYNYVQDVFGFSYSANSVGSNSITFPATEPGGQLHYITALHSTNTPITIRSNLVLAGVTFPTNVTALVLRGTNPLLMVTAHGQGRAVQWGGYNWMTMAVKGPVAGLDDLMWRSMVWAARKPFVMRGMPPLVTMRFDDVGGPSPNATTGLSWVQDAINSGFKPYLSLFFGCLDTNEAAVIRNFVTNGNATTSIHSWGCTGSSGGRNWFLYDHFGAANWPNAQMNNDFAYGLQWHVTNGIPISKVVVPHYSEIGSNTAAGLKSWGVEFLTIKCDPGTLRTAPWLVAGPYRLYEPRQSGDSLYPLFYADFMSPPYDEIFNTVIEVRDDAACAEWCPDPDVAASIGRGTRQLKRGLDSMAYGTLYTHEFYIHPTVDNNGYPSITTTNWRAILSGITNGMASYNPQYVTLDYACQYTRATRTATITNAVFDPASGEVQLGLGGRADLQLQVQVYVGEGNSISNRPAFVPAFTNAVSVSAAVVPAPASITVQPLGGTVAAGSNFTFSANATGTAPLVYQWRFNGANLNEATNSSLAINAVQPANAGAYDVVVTNVLGAATSTNAVLTVLVPLTITNQPQSQTVIAGAPFALTVGATGDEPISYQWQHDGVNALDATNAVLSVAAASTVSAGFYSVQVSNATGFVSSSNALLTVLFPPTITNQPQSQTLLAGTSFSLKVDADGTLPMTYQWQRNGTNAPEATNAAFIVDYALPSVAGAYSVQVSNVAGFATSSNALVVVSLPDLTLQGSIRPRSFALSFNTTPGSNYSVEYTPGLVATSWFTLSNLLASGTNSLVFDTQLTVQRLYRVRLGAGSSESVFLNGGFKPPQFLLTFNAVTGLNYTVEYSGSFSNWQPLASFIASVTNIVYPDDIVKSQRFYRVSTPLE